MTLQYEKTFKKDIEKLRNGPVKQALLDTIQKLKDADTLQAIPGMKKMLGYENYYRIRIGDYRLGIRHAADSGTIILVRLKHRKDIYKSFP